MGEEILAVAKGLCNCGEEDEPLLQKLCEAGEAAVRSRLRAGLTPEDCAGAFVCAAAWLAAAAMLEAEGGSEELSSLRAGDMTIRLSGGGDRAAALRRSARQLMEPYTEGGGFFFCGVRG